MKYAHADTRRDALLAVLAALDTVPPTHHAQSVRIWRFRDVNKGGEWGWSISLSYTLGTTNEPESPGRRRDIAITAYELAFGEEQEDDDAPAR
jgi:hypothetical protein